MAESNPGTALQPDEELNDNDSSLGEVGVRAAELRLRPLQMGNERASG